MGWSSWIALGPGAEAPIFDFCDEFSVKASIDALVALGLRDVGYRSAHLDDCWAGGRNATGYLYPEADHFPNGMKAVVDYAHSKNISFGLYTCAGTFTCVGGRPGSKDHWQQDAAVFAEWGLDFVKMDWCFTDGMVPQEAYGNMSAALNETGRPILFNMCEWGVDNPWQWGDQFAQSWRMAGDHTGVWTSTKATVAASAAIPAQYTGRAYGWNDMDMLETGCGFGGPGMNPLCAHANNREATMTEVEYKTEFSMWAISASPLIFTSPIMNCTAPSPAPATTCNVSLISQHSIAPCTAGVSFGCWGNQTMWTDSGCRGEFECNGADVTCDIDGAGIHTCDCINDANVTCTPWISDVQREILFNSEVIAVNQDVTPQGRPLYNPNNPADISIWARNLSDGSIAVAFYNQNDTALSLGPVSFAALGWGSGTMANVRDLWAHADLGTVTGSFPASGGVNVPAHGTFLVRLTQAGAASAEDHHDAGGDE